MIREESIRKESIHKVGRVLLVTAALAQLAACASAAKPEAMVATTTTSQAPFPQGLQHAMCVRSVTGGQKTNALWVSKVDDQSFNTALLIARMQDHLMPLLDEQLPGHQAEPGR